MPKYIKIPKHMLVCDACNELLLDEEGIKFTKTATGIRGASPVTRMTRKICEGFILSQLCGYASTSYSCSTAVSLKSAL